MRSTILLFVGLTAVVGALLGCSTEPKSAEKKMALENDITVALNQFEAADPGLQAELKTVAGYAVFPRVGKAAAGVGGAYGRGEVFAGGKRIGYCDLSQATVGPQLGAQNFRELILFKDNAALDRFKANQLTFAAGASAIAIKPGAVSSMAYKDGVAVFAQSTEGLMLELAIGGQSLRFTPS